MIHNLFKNEVNLEPLSHRYYDDSGLEYFGFSRSYEFLVKKFDSEKIAGYCSNENESKEDVLNKWTNQRDNGTRIDNQLESFAQTATIDAGNEDIKVLVEEVMSKYKFYNKTFEQVVVYDKGYRVAGSLDKLSLVSNRKDSRFHLSDFKAFEKGEKSLYEVKGQAWLNAPFSHLPNTKYVKISFQLSFYAFLLEKLTGRKCERLFIDLIVPKVENGKVVSFTNHVVPVSYLKNDIQIFLDHFKGNIMDDLNNVVDAAYESSDDIF